MSASIFDSSSDRIKALRAGIRLNDKSSILSGDDDPTSVAKDAAKGSLWLRTGASGGNVYKKNDDGSTTNWTVLPVSTTPSAPSDINYITNPGAEVDTSDWGAYADAAASTPADGTGGSPNITLTRSVSSPLIDNAHFLITKDAANRQGEGVSTDFAVDKALLNQPIKINFYYNKGGSYSTGDIKVFVYDKDAATLVTLSDNTLYDNYERYTGVFHNENASTNFRLILHITSTNASSYTLEFDGVEAKPYSPGSTQVVSSVSATKTPTASGNYQQFTGNSIALDEGEWILYGHIQGFASGSPNYNRVDARWGSANGADNSTPPSDPETSANIEDLGTGQDEHIVTGTNSSQRDAHAPIKIIRVTDGPTNVFLNAFVNAGTPGDARVIARLTAWRLS